MRPGDNKWSITLWARNPETGQAKWAYQILPHDAWDYDEIMENIVVDMMWQGKMRKLLLHPGAQWLHDGPRPRNRRVAVGHALPALELVARLRSENRTAGCGSAKVTHTGITLAECVLPRPVARSSCLRRFHLSPDTSISRRTTPAWITAASQANYIAGTPYLGSSTTMYPGPGGYQGELVAWDVANARKVWGIKDADLPVLQRCAGHRRRSGFLRNHGG